MLASSFLLLSLSLPTQFGFGGPVVPTIERWHPHTLQFSGPETSETAETNPFRDHRIDVTFTHKLTGRTQVRPGFFAASNGAANTGATAGDEWQCRFTPWEAGEYAYTVRHRQGRDVALPAPSEDPGGTPGELDAQSGTFTVGESTAGKPSFHARGTVSYRETRYLYCQGDGFRVLKSGFGSPENLLGYVDFDDTYKHDKAFRPSEVGVGRQRKNDHPNAGTTLHAYEPHVQDWRPGDPQWGQGENAGRGKGLIGLVNYATSQGLNSGYFLLMNATGDGQDVWPWIGPGPESRDRFDVSKLDQWNIVFTHMQDRGLLMHLFLQETENDQLLDDGDLGPLRRLYLREMVARFGHHPGLIWNLGEENTQTSEQLLAMSDYLRQLDPEHPRTVHTYPNKMHEVFDPLLGKDAIECASLQVGNPSKVHEQTLEWIRLSQKAGQPWVANLDEIGPANTGVKPDADDPDHDAIRSQCLWGHLLAGGGGCEWYFGYKYVHSDITCEDLRSRERWWQQCRTATDFCNRMPLEGMDPADDLTPATDDYVLASRGAIYVVYHPPGWFEEHETARLTLQRHDQFNTYRVTWFDAKNGGEEQDGGVAIAPAGENVDIGHPPERAGDWVAIVRRQIGR